MMNINPVTQTVAPARERGLKLSMVLPPCLQISRSREGAWIEIGDKIAESLKDIVAPARERGLK